MAVALIVYGGAHWAQMESPALGMRWVFGLAALAILPAIVSAYGHQRLAWLVALPAACVAAVGLVTGLWPWSTQHGFYPRAVAGVLNDGAHSWFTAHTPFDAGRFVAVDSDLKLAFFALAAILAWTLICRGWALAAVAVGFLLFAFPSTVVDMSAGGLRAAIFLGLALGALYVTGDRLPRSGAAPQAALLGATAVIAGLIVGGAPGVSKQAFLGWQQWNPLAKPDKLVNVQYVWDQNYKPLHWPKKRTVVMEVHSPVPLYWKAAVLTAFNNDHWTQARRVDPERQPGRRLLSDPARLPAAERRHGRHHRHRQDHGEDRRARRPAPDRHRPGDALDVPAGRPLVRRARRHRDDDLGPAAGRDLRRDGIHAEPVADRSRIDRHGLPAGGHGRHHGGRDAVRAVRVGKAPDRHADPGGLPQSVGSGVARVGRRQGQDAVHGRVPCRAIPPVAAVQVRPHAGAQEGRPAARRLHDAERTAATARCSRARWRSCCGCTASPPGLRSASRPEGRRRSRATRTSSPTATPTHGSRSSSPATGGCRSSRLRRER